MGRRTRGVPFLLLTLVLAGLPIDAPADEIELAPWDQWRIWSPSGTKPAGALRAARNRVVLGNDTNKLRVLLHPKPLEGQFDVRVDLSPYEGVDGGLILIPEKDGKPDKRNFVLIERKHDGDALVVRLGGRENGKRLAVPQLRLQNSRLEGDPDVLKKKLLRGVIELHEDAPTLRLLRNTVGGLIHLQYADHREIDGEVAEGWTELPTVPDQQGVRYYLGVFARKASEGAKPSTLTFSKARATSPATQDLDDSATGFGATRRNYVWGGYEGDAVVVTFDEKADTRGAKFVFWAEANYIPWWHLDDLGAVSYEFVEIWGGDTVGCNEPMSDHLLRWSRAKIVESNPARVVVQWDYVLVDSAYRWWNNHPTIRPTVTEVFTFYPDATGVRKVVYRPPLEAHETHHKWGHELAEMMVVAAGDTRANRHLAQQAISMIALDDTQHDYLWDLSQYTQDQWRHNTDDWPAVIVRTNMKPQWPSTFIAFAQDERVKQHTSPTTPIKFGGDWELRGRSRGEQFLSEDGLLDFGGFSHWPVMKQPYDNREWIGAGFIREPKHTSLISITSGPGGFTWPKGPNKQRTFAMLVGMCDHDDSDDLRRRVNSWLYPGTVETTSRGLTYTGPDYYERALRFEASPRARQLSFRVTPESILRNPVLVIDGWSARAVGVELDGQTLPDSRFRHARLDDGRTVVWIEANLTAETEIRLQARR